MAAVDESFDFSMDGSVDDENYNPQKTAVAAKPSKAASKGKTKTIEETYQKKTQLEHILLRPDTYIGSVEQLTQPMFILNSETDRIVQKEISFTPGLYKIFDEILVNAADNKQRDPNMDRLEVEIDAETNTISVKNNGKGIPVVEHKEHNCYVPTLIFGHLLTGSNFDDDEKKTTGGRNGYGAKLANIFSTEFTVECLDTENEKQFTQTFRDNMSRTEDPSVKKATKSEMKKGDYTKITFKPDLNRFNMEKLDEYAVGLLSRRAYDIAGSMSGKGGKKLSVFLNGKKLPIKDFKSYLALFDDLDAPLAFERVNDDWEVGVGVNTEGSGMKQISFVNAIATTKGGSHVNFITSKIVKAVQAVVEKRNKGGKKAQPAQIKNHLTVFINCLVENPTFDSQTKENMTLKQSSFNKKIALSDQFMKKVEKCGIVEIVIALSKFKEGEALKRKGGKKKSKLKGITKLDDANNAGTAKSKDCTLIITEGDSAKSLAVSGLSVVGRDFYGVFPLKGKPLNVRDATHAQIMKNEEIMNLVEIMGLKFGTTYSEENIKSLRYGHLMIMADQDHDGSHIKGLIINFIHHFWPSLLDVPGFLQQFITPIVKCTKGKKSETFFTLPEYNEWKEGTGDDARGWSIKYYKGLGTSTSNEAKQYFSNLESHVIEFNRLSTDIPDEDDDDVGEEEGASIPRSGDDLIQRFFSKKFDKKQWMKRGDKASYIDYSEAGRRGLQYSELFNKEIRAYSTYDVDRSLPHVFDGLKTSQRKVLFACFKKKLKNEIKVAQLAGYIGEHSAYHHGEMSLNGTVIGMAQSYCGSNNINLLYPSGQFGTRRMGGKDHASARYIFTRLEKITRTIFHPDDDALLTYLNDDGLSIEPEFYMPVIPMLLVNGCQAIGTGWSSTVPQFSPREIISNLRKMIRKEDPEEMHPFNSGWMGELECNSKGGYKFKGKIRRKNETTLVITELPVGKWTQDYKMFLEGLMASDEEKERDIEEALENHTDTQISFTIKALSDKLDVFEESKDGLLGKFKLVQNRTFSNMQAFDRDLKITRYENSMEILRTFFTNRMVYYVARKGFLLDRIGRELSILKNKARFVEEVCNEELVVSNRKRKELLHDLKERGYDLFPKDEKKRDDEEDDDEASVEESASDADLAKGFEYLLGMKIWSLTHERAEELRRQRAEKADEVDELNATSPEQLWSNDLDAIDEALTERDADIAADLKEEMNAQAKNSARNKKKAASKAKAAKKAKKKVDEWDSDLEESDDDFVVKKPVPKKKVAPKKAPAPKKTAPRKKAPSAVAAALATLETLSISEPAAPAPLPVKEKPSPRKTSAPVKKAAPKKTAPQKKPAKKVYDSDEFMSDDSDSSDVEVISSPVAPRARSGRAAAKKVVYAVDDSDDSDSEFEFD
mmetsp:Transcript_33371/g.74997  ORF Transcript_33371/g.74997 Transcript_33371/m.74997 type:complete len:1397 (+) Transcript_33371:148-4338(+)